MSSNIITMVRKEHNRQQYLKKENKNEPKDINEMRIDELKQKLNEIEEQISYLNAKSKPVAVEIKKVDIDC